MDRNRVMSHSKFFYIEDTNIGSQKYSIAMMDKYEHLFDIYIV